MAKNNLPYTIIRPATHEEWLEERKKGIGSSEVGTILGVNKWDTPYKLWRRKKELDPPVEETLIMKLGHYFEQAVAQCFADETGATIIKNTAGDWIAVSKEHDFFRVSPDRLYYPKGAKKVPQNRCILECKTTRMNIDPENLPKYWWCQIQYQMHVLGIKHGALAWIKNGTEFGYCEIDYNPRFAEFMSTALEAFWWRHMENNEEPPVESVEDVMSKFPESTPDSVCVSRESEVFRAWMELKEIKAQLSVLDEKKKACENMLKMEMKECDCLTVKDPAGGAEILCTWRTPAKPTMKFDDKTFKEVHPKLYEDFCKPTIGPRRFVMK